MDSRAPMSRLEVLLQDIDLPERAYESAQRRYEDLGRWFARPDSALSAYDTHVFVQGSFALGTAIRPLNGEDYDLDFSCKLRTGISRASHSQKDLKDLVGRELESYRRARNIERALKAKNRCWRLHYQDELPFHMDVVPGLPADEARRQVLRERMTTTAGLTDSVAQEAARRALWITDQQHPAYPVISDDWPSSNPGGYQYWFLSRMEGAQERVLAKAQVDPVPVYRAKSPLQQAVQLLKRHRDAMFLGNPDAKPASIILTTVVGQAFVPSESLEQTLVRALAALDRVRQSDTDSIPNPVNSKENFADRWHRIDCQHLHLKKNFHEWVKQANADFSAFLASGQANRLRELAEQAFALRPGEHAFNGLPGVVAASAAPAIVRAVSLTSAPARPWGS